MPGQLPAEPKTVIPTSTDPNAVKAAVAARGAAGLKPQEAAVDVAGQVKVKPVGTPAPKPAPAVAAATEPVVQPAAQQPAAKAAATTPAVDPAKAKLNEIAKQQVAKDAERQRLAKIETDAKRLGEIAELMKRDPIAAMEALGGKWDDIAAAQLKRARDPNGVKMSTLEEKLANVNKLVDEKFKTFQDTQRTQAETQLASETERIGAEMKARVEANKEKYPMTSALKEGHLVSAEILRHYDETLKAGAPVMLSEDEAAEIVEKRGREGIVAITKALGGVLPAETKAEILKALGVESASTLESETAKRKIPNGVVKQKTKPGSGGEQDFSRQPARKPDAPIDFSKPGALKALMAQKGLLAKMQTAAPKRYEPTAK